MLPTVTFHAGQLIAGRYRLVEPLAHGGMGAIWRAHHEQLDAPVAVKLMTTALDAALLARFEREAKACARMNSPHVVRVHDYGTEDRIPFMVMELLTGEDLSVRLKRVGRLTVAELLPVAFQISKGLTVAHDAGIIHRDLKPANVFITTSGREEIVKLLDFGIARETEARLVDDHTTTGIVLGSPHHMSPEQAAGIEVDLRTDLWSFGVLLYQALTGARPFRGESLSAIVYAIATETPAPPSQIDPSLPPGLDAFFERALARRRDHRFTSADEMTRAFFESVGQTASSFDESSPSMRMARSAAARASLSGYPPAPARSSQTPPPLPQPVAIVAPAEIPSSPTLATASQSLSVAPADNPFQQASRKRQKLLAWGGAGAAALTLLVVLGLRFMTQSSSLQTAGSSSAVAPEAPAASPVPTDARTAKPEPASSTSAGASASAAPTQAPATQSSSTTKAPKPAQPVKPSGDCPSGKVRDGFTGLCVSPR